MRTGPTTSIDIPRDARTQAICSVQRYFEAHMDDKIGNIAAGALLGFFLEEIAQLVERGADHVRRHPHMEATAWVAGSSWRSSSR